MGECGGAGLDIEGVGIDLDRTEQSSVVGQREPPSIEALSSSQAKGGGRGEARKDSGKVQ